MRFQQKSFIFIFILFIALAYRLPGLSLRPMHTDEAVHAVKFGALLEKNQYRYNPVEYHGPTLNYFTLIPARIAGVKSLARLNESILRIVPVFFGILLILLLYFLTPELGWRGVLWAALFTSLSPALIFYSRYYIQEILLLCFTFAVLVFGFRYLQNKKLIWAALTGISLGLMHATKETAIIAIASMAAAGVATYFLHSTFRQDVKTIRPGHILVAVFTALSVSFLFYSSFFSHPGGFVDSLLTYKNYLNRAGANPFHIHPWHYYFRLLLFFKNGPGPVWSEGFIVLFGILGAIFAFWPKKQGVKTPAFPKFIAFYTIFMTVIYCLIPYKTPWSMLGFLHGFILLAGFAVAELMRTLQTRFGKALLMTILLAGFLHLGWESRQLNFKWYDDPRNPYVYSHPRRDILDIPAALEKIAGNAPQGHDLYIQVICPNDDYWPLPWYLRKFRKVGWWNHVDMQEPSAPVILSSPQFEDDLLHKFYEIPTPGQRTLYVPLFDSRKELRPGIEIRGYVTNEIMTRYYR